MPSQVAACQDGWAGAPRHAPDLPCIMAGKPPRHGQSCLARTMHALHRLRSTPQGGRAGWTRRIMHAGGGPL